jgi:hypothetical protein
MRSMQKQLLEIGKLLGLDCGDNSCLCAARKGGMRTNGGCRCDISGAVARALACASSVSETTPIVPLVDEPGSAGATKLP